MERLTENEIMFNNKHSSWWDKKYHALYNKLKPLEDIEQELGIDLITLFRLKDIYVKNAVHNEIEHTAVLGIDIFKKTIKAVGIYGTYTDIELSRYGKTWALTKEELEK